MIPAKELLLSPAKHEGLVPSLVELLAAARTCGLTALKLDKLFQPGEYDVTSNGLHPFLSDTQEASGSNVALCFWLLALAGPPATNAIMPLCQFLAEREQFSQSRSALALIL